MPNVLVEAAIFLLLCEQRWPILLGKGFSNKILNKGTGQNGI